MRYKLLTILGCVILATGLLQFVGNPASWFRFQAHANGADLLRGCTDVPEAVALADELQVRALRIERYAQELERKKAEIREAETSLQSTLTEITKARNAKGNQKATTSKEVSDDVLRLVALYDQMKPEQAAGVLANLPPDFAAEILMRVQPENGARIIASIDPNQAAILTSFMGARSARRN